MTDPVRPAARKRAPACTPLALAAGIGSGHVVAAMAAQDAAGPATVVAALVFVAAGAAGTVCALAGMAAGDGAPVGRSEVLRWATAIGAGLVGTLAPGML